MAGPLYQGNCNYTPLAAGTTTVNAGPANVEPGYFGVFYGFNLTGLGTATSLVLAAYDVQTNQASGTPVLTTNTLMVGTGTGAGQVLAAGPGELGLRYLGALVVVATGTSASANALWD
jgi:hypothetical protein